MKLIPLFSGLTAFIVAFTIGVTRQAFKTDSQIIKLERVVNFNSIESADLKENIKKALTLQSHEEWWVIDKRTVCSDATCSDKIVHIESPNLKSETYFRKIIYPGKTGLKISFSPVNENGGIKKTVAGGLLEYHYL